MKELGEVLRLRRLRWFGHVVRRDETEILRKSRIFEVPDADHLHGRQRKTLKKNMQETELASLNLRENQALGRNLWRTFIYRLNS